MDSVWLEDFIALLECGSFSRAAERRNITQPAFGRRIRALESWVGSRLVDRDRVGNPPTAAGLSLRMTAEDVLKRLRLGREQALASSACVPIACTHLLSSTFFPAFLDGIEMHLPNVNLQLRVDNMEACERFMREGEIALLLCHRHPCAPSHLENPRFERITLGKDLLLPLSGSSPSGTPLHEVPVRSGSRARFLAYGEPSGLGRIMRGTGLYERVAGTLDTVFSSHAALTLAMLAVAGRGLAWLPRSALVLTIADRPLVPAAGDEWAIDVDIVLYRPRVKQAPAIEAFWGLAQAESCGTSRQINDP